MAAIIGIDRNGFPFSTDKMRSILQRTIESITKEEYIEFLEKYGYDVDEDYENQDVIKKFKANFLSGLVNEQPYPHGLSNITFYEVDSSGTVEEVYFPADISIFYVEFFEWDSTLFEKTHDEEKECSIIEQTSREEEKLKAWEYYDNIKDSSLPSLCTELP